MKRLLTIPLAYVGGVLAAPGILLFMLAVWIETRGE
jgi:hypothetical protein